MNTLLHASEGAYLALHGLVIVAESAPERVNIKTLAEKLNASEAHLAKVFQKLNKADVVESVRGPAGGFTLQKKTEDISFLDIIEIIDGKISINGCPFGKTKCVFSKCIFNEKVNKITSELADAYQKLKLSDF